MASTTYSSYFDIVWEPAESYTPFAVVSWHSQNVPTYVCSLCFVSFYLFAVVTVTGARDMKEKMAGPGDTYAKDTRAYNPEFAAAAGDEEEYDKKIQEV